MMSTKKKQESLVVNQRPSIWKYVKNHPMMYLMLVPGLFFLFIYKFWPLYGLAMAFEDYNIFAGTNPMNAI